VVVAGNELNAYLLRMAVSTSGAVVLAWRNSIRNGNGDPLRVAYYPAGAGWTRPLTAARPRVAPHAVTIGPAGGATVLYQNLEGHLTARRRTPSRWQPPVPLPARTATFDAASGAPGVTVAVWKTPRTKLKTARFADGAWTRPRLVADPIRDVFDPSVTAARDGSADFAWLSGSFENARAVRAAHQAESGTLGRAQVLCRAPWGCGGNTLAGTGRGDAFVAWTGPLVNGTLPVQVAWHDANSQQWSDAVTISGDYPAEDRPSMAVAADGSAVVAWLQADPRLDPSDYPSVRVVVNQSLPTSTP
jgi:hypothetical protein